MKIKTLSLSLIPFALSLLIPATAAARLKVFVSIPPQQQIVKYIGGERVDVHVMVQPGASPHTYEPKPRQMVAISRTDIYFTVGVEFEGAWMPKLTATNPKMAVVPTDAGIRKIPITGYHHEEESHDDHEEHAEHEDHANHDEHDHDDGLDPHIWLSPPLYKQQAATVLAALIKVDPSNKAGYEAGYSQLVGEIDRLDRELKSMFQHRHHTRFLVFHPSWGYFAKAYGLEQVAIEIEGKSPKPAQIKRIIELMREESIRVIFVQPQFSARSAKLIAGAVDGKVVAIDPLAEDWLSNMRQVAEKFRQALD